MPGPIPKRTSERRRNNKPEPGMEVVKAPSATKEPTWPAPNANWHPIAIDLYTACKISGQAQFFEQSDVAMAVYAAEITSRTLEESADGKHRLFAAAIETCVGMWGNLLCTEGDRRRLRVELERVTPEQPASVLMLDKYRKAIQ